MTDYERLTQAVTHFTGMTPEEFELSADCWQYRTYQKGEYYNHYRNVCKYMGFILDGVFRSYIIDEKTGEEKNIFLYSSNGFVVTFKSFINQLPCDYHTQAMTESHVVYIGIADLLSLYQRSHAWERFGRLLAQHAFNIAMERNESLLFKSPEERYLDLVRHHPDIFSNIPLYHISSYLGIQGPSLSRIRKRLAKT